MKKLFIATFVFFAIVANLINAQEKPDKEYTARYEQVMKRTQWWRNARFGMFIHFGAYAVAARGEWVKSNEHLTTQQYQKYVDEFNPVDFDAKKWAKAAKAAGMKYAVLTAKHHDGFCMFDSKLTDYKISTRFKGRDLVREFLDAFRAEGIKVGLYYSLIDWHHPDYPNVGNHPQRNDKEYGKRKFDWDNYLKYMHGQVEELVKNYGKIDIMWFDYSFDDYNGEKWKAKELVDMVRKYQPDIILDNRLEINHNMGAAERMVSSYGDFETPEQGIPDAPLFDKYGNPIPWETCLTMNDSWGYNESDKNWKSPELIIQSLVNCVSKSGNMLLNVGPNARGNFPEESLHILREVGNWMNKNSESIYGCKASDLAKPEWGRYTQNGNTIYAHWMYPYLGHLKVSGLNDKVKNIYLLSSGAELHYQSTLWNNNEAGNVFIPLNPNTRKYDAVIKIVTKD
ncbi:MAG: alpha-L-fucosidase [Bacteroidota bacterium]|nr:alpha-L-fucosidase [Bacteroidota bacterium]MDP4274969.1 alpha-L-fucosidase [Bacteroidota bacterium]